MCVQSFLLIKNGENYELIRMNNEERLESLY